jgi:spore coat protein CotH
MADSLVLWRNRALPLLPLLLLIDGCGSSAPLSPADEGVVREPFCSGDPQFVPGSATEQFRRPDTWTVESHCPGTKPDYEEVFDPTIVRRFDITIAPEDYARTEDDLRANYASAGGDLDAVPPPIFVPATVTYNSQVWTGVGFRWKGNASLKGGWVNGNRKLSFVLEFEYYEYENVDIFDQRFFGFRRLNFANAYKDASLMRDRIAAKIFRDAGVPAARSSYAAVYIDIGEGPVYRGLYTLMENPPDQMLREQIGDGRGNLYKPWGDAARWESVDEAAAAEGLDQEAYLELFKVQFEKNTDGEPKDWSDVLAAISALHADRTDAATWRDRFEEHFDVSAFLRVLAVNQVMVNWDSYGCMHHNYMVYANPLNGHRLQWLPWDLNEAMTSNPRPDCPAPGSLLLDETANPAPDSSITEWPLISILLSDPVYRAEYIALLGEVASGAFAAEPLIAQMRADHDLIAPYVVGPIETEVFPYASTTQSLFRESLTTGRTALEPHVLARQAAAQAVLAANP